MRGNWKVEIRCSMFMIRCFLPLLTASTNPPMLSGFAIGEQAVYCNTTSADISVPVSQAPSIYVNQNLQFYNHLSQNNRCLHP